MKTLFTTLFALGVFAFGSTANAVTVNPSITFDGTGSEFVCDMGVTCWDGTGSTNSSFTIDTLMTATGYDGVLDLLYKANVEYDAYDNYIEDEAGTFADSYHTLFGSVGVDANASARIVYDAGNEPITCPDCFLVVKDGTSPFWYIYNIDDWNGTDVIGANNFWLGNGEISHVAIYGADAGGDRDLPQVPVPAAVWLFGSGLLGLVAVGRRKV